MKKQIIESTTSTKFGDQAKDVLFGGKKWEDYDTIVCPDGQIIDMQFLLDEQDKARAALNHLLPALGGLVGKLRFIYTFRVKTQATDGYNLFVNPQFTYNLDFTGKVFVMAHEVMHCLLNHLRRGKGHDHTRSNVAADYEVNDTLVEIGLCKASTIQKIGALYDKKYNDWGYEAIYKDISQTPNQTQDNSNQASQAAKNQNQQGGKGPQNQQGSGNSRGNGSQGVVRPEDCIDSSGAAKTAPDTAGSMIDKGLGDKLAESEGYDKEGPNGDSLSDSWKQEAEKVAKNVRGKGPGFAKLAAKILDFTKPAKNWKKELQKVVGRTISEDSKRRGYTNNNVLVSQDRIALTDKQKFDTLDSMFVCLDVSGSFWGEPTKRALVEACHVAMTKKPLRIYMLQWDDRVSKIDVFTSYTELVQFVKAGKFTLSGGGGTTAGCIWREMKSNKIFKRLCPELVMIFTDGYIETPIPKRDPRHMQNLCWVIFNNNQFEAQKDAHTFTVHVDLEEF